MDVTNMTEEDVRNFGYELWCAAAGKERGKDELAEKLSSFTKKVLLFLATPIELLSNIKMFFTIFLRDRKDIFGKLAIHIDFERRYLKERGWIES